MTDSEKRIIIDAFLNKDYKIIINSFSYERRKELFQSIEQLGDEIENELGTVIPDIDGDNFIASFFTNDEAISYFYETDDVDIKRDLTTSNLIFNVFKPEPTMMTKTCMNCGNNTPLIKQQFMMI